MYDAGFKWLRNVFGGGNCYYFSVFCGYYETLITGEDGLIERFIETLQNGIVGIKFTEPDEINALEYLTTVLKRLADVRNKLGIKKALNEFLITLKTQRQFFLHTVYLLKHAIYNSIMAKDSKTYSMVKIYEQTMSPEEFAANIIKEMGVWARSVCLILTAYALRIHIPVTPFNTDLEFTIDHINDYNPEPIDFYSEEETKLICHENKLDLSKYVINVVYYESHYQYITKGKDNPRLAPYADYDQALADIHSLT